MNNSTIFFMDDAGNEDPKERATKANITEYDENGDRIGEVYLLRQTNTD